MYTQILMYKVEFSSSRKLKTPLSSSAAAGQLPGPSDVFLGLGKQLQIATA